MANELPNPISKKEKFLAKAAGMDVEIPEAITREEMYLEAIAEGGGGGGGGDSYTKAETDALLNNKQNVLTVGTNLDDEPIEDSTNPITSGGVFDTVGNIDLALDGLIMSLEPKIITANGTYDPADDGVDGYSEVTVNVPEGVNIHQLSTTSSTVNNSNIKYLYYNKVLYIFGTLTSQFSSAEIFSFESQLSDIGITGSATSYIYGVSTDNTSYTSQNLTSMSTKVNLPGTSGQRKNIIGVFQYS